jgi:hypothetical protein
MEGFIHKGRLVYALQYDLVGRGSIIVWLDEGGNDLNGRVQHSDPQRSIVTARAGDVIFYEGQPVTVERGVVYRALKVCSTPSQQL